MSDPEFVTVKEAAALLRVNINTLYAVIRAGQLPGVARFGRNVIRINRAALAGVGLTEQCNMTDSGTLPLKEE